MISGLPGVVVVDDRQDELDSIKEAFLVLEYHVYRFGIIMVSLIMNQV